MKILHVTDFHGRIDWFAWLIREAQNHNLLVISGDLLDASSPETLDSQIADVTALIRKIQVTVTVVSGNHDGAPDAEPGLPLWLHEIVRFGAWADGDRFVLCGYRFACMPWNIPLDSANPGEIWIIHVPPSETDTASCGEGHDDGDPELAELCRIGRGPRIVLCGHVHSPMSWHARAGDTVILNPGRADRSPVPAYIVVDLVEQTATRHWPGAAPETIALGNPPIRQLGSKLSADRIEKLLDHAVSNQAAEDFRLTPKEIAEVCRRLHEACGED